MSERHARHFLTVSEAAARRIRTILAKSEADNALRISVEGGGCSGFSYKFDLTHETESDDLVIEKDGARVLVDQTSLAYLDGSVVDFVDDLMGQSFQIRNPTPPRLRLRNVVRDLTDAGREGHGLSHLPRPGQDPCCSPPGTSTA